MIFQDKSIHPDLLAQNIITCWSGVEPTTPPSRDLSVRMRPHQMSYIARYFDGAAQNSCCGCGAQLKLDTRCHYKIFQNGGPGTNTRAEVLDLWGLMWFARQLCVDRLTVFGDSHVVINYMKNTNALSTPQLIHQPDRIKALCDSFNHINFFHVYKEKNSEADHLSKMGLEKEFGLMYYQLFEGGIARAQVSVLH